MKPSSALKQDTAHSGSSSKTYLDEQTQPPNNKRQRSDEGDDIPFSKRQRAGITAGLEAPILCQPAPRKPCLDDSYASFLRGFVDPIDGGEDIYVAEWLQNVGVDRDKNSRSDTCILQGVPSREEANSVPVSEAMMSYTVDPDGFTVPPRPSSSADSYRLQSAESIATQSNAGSGQTSSGKSLLETPSYRVLNLASNGIHIHPHGNELPKSVADLVNQVGQQRKSPEPTIEAIQNDNELCNLFWGAEESAVGTYFQKLMPEPPANDILRRSNRQPMARTTAVRNTGAQYKTSTPVPDILYGYDRQGAFPNEQTQIMAMGTSVVANSVDLILPFFVIEFKGDSAGGSGSMWVATNQCLGGSTACVNIAERVNERLKLCQGQSTDINTATFSAAINNTEARLYVSWKDDKREEYYMANFQNCLLHDPKHFRTLRRCLRNIIDWGKDQRLQAIHQALQTILEENRKCASEMAKARPPPDHTQSPTLLSDNTSDGALYPSRGRGRSKRARGNSRSRGGSLQSRSSSGSSNIRGAGGADS